MRVAVDARHLAAGRGVAQYTRGMLRALAQEFPGDEWIAFVPSGGAAAAAALGGGAAAAGGGGAVGGFRVVEHSLPSRVLFGAAAVAGRPRLDELAGGDVDLVWIPAPAPVAVSHDTPYVLTVHDLSWLERPRDFTAYERLWHRAGRLERLARDAAAVVADSEATAASVERRWSLEATVVYPGVTAPVDGPPPPGLPDRFFLAVGALEPRKAPEVIAAAHAQAGTQAELVFVGDGRSRPLHGRVVQATALKPLYERAEALVMPSRLEGFGFPPLEAALCGTPSIVSDLPVFAETLGDAAIRVPVDDVDALATALEAPPGRQLGERARERAERFTWTRAAHELHAVLERAAR